MSIFYIPHDGFAADFIPFYHEACYHLFYLKDYRNIASHGEGTPWFHLVTRDFVDFEELGEAIPRGAADSQDLWIFTGSVIEHDKLFHIYYTGHNSHFANTGKPVQVIMHATSSDLKSWTKDIEFGLGAPASSEYEPDDWRDPFVFRNDEQSEYWMLIAARRKNGPSRHRGLIALASSPDLHQWRIREPFWAPNLYYTHECPDLFRIGEWWYLVYSTFSERHVTHYRMSKSLDGPWLAPANDAFDTRAYYAAKTAGDRKKRFAFGWLATRENEKDDGHWNWGGNLVVHEIMQEVDGSLSVRVPESVMAPFKTQVPMEFQPLLGQWEIQPQKISARSVGRFSVLALGNLPDRCIVEAQILIAADTANAGLLVRMDDRLENYYQVRLEPGNQRMVFDRWHRNGDQPFIFERPLKVQPGKPVHLLLLIDGTCIVCYADRKVALSCRMYQHRTGQLGLFVSEGFAMFQNVTVKI
ncbi:family 43 glycosylhydrolase [candidate division KSB1 bacterium]|nr:family 43 glycosylhydrolase [candidate division KSB1 bacterium]